MYTRKTPKINLTSKMSSIFIFFFTPPLGQNGWLNLQSTDPLIVSYGCWLHVGQFFADNKQPVLITLVCSLGHCWQISPVMDPGPKMLSQVQVQVLITRMSHLSSCLGPFKGIAAAHPSECAGLSCSCPWPSKQIKASGSQCQSAR